MEIPHGFEFEGSRHCLHIKKNLYGQKQAGRVWNKHLRKGLVQMGFRLSSVDEKLSYRSVIGKLNFLEKSSHPDLVYSVHNAARFSSAPKESRSQSVKRIGCYLLGTRDKSTVMKSDPSRSIEVYADADFCGLFNPETALYDPVTAKSRTGYIVTNMGCPIIWAIKLQTEMALRCTEAEYGSCSEALLQMSFPS
jgi:hypothetical protein